MQNPWGEFDVPKEDRRQYVRINKQYILSYFNKDNPDDKHEITQLKNISLGGMCFVASKSLNKGRCLGISLRTPYLSETTYFEGTVLESMEKAKNLIYEVRLEFSGLNVQAESLIKKIMEVFFSSKGGA